MKQIQQLQIGHDAAHGPQDQPDPPREALRERPGAGVVGLIVGDWCAERASSRTARRSLPARRTAPQPTRDPEQMRRLICKQTPWPDEKASARGSGTGLVMGQGPCDGSPGSFADLTDQPDSVESSHMNEPHWNTCFSRMVASRPPPREKSAYDSTRAF